MHQNFLIINHTTIKAIYRADWKQVFHYHWRLIFTFPGKGSFDPSQITEEMLKMQLWPEIAKMFFTLHYMHQMVWAMPSKLQIHFIVQEVIRTQIHYLLRFFFFNFLSIYYSPLCERKLQEQSRGLSSFNPDTYLCLQFGHKFGEGETELQMQELKFPCATFVKISRL